MSGRRSFFLALVGLLAAHSAHASFHFMQIEQVIGGVNGNFDAQAVQLRMRSSFQNQVQLSRILVRDAAGANPILLKDLDNAVPNFQLGDRVLIASPDFQLYTTPPLTPDFVMTNLIPPSYLAAGSLTFEDNFGTIYWRVSWGGAAYTGPGTGSFTNDADGNFNPPFGSPLPAGSDQAIQFRFSASAASTNNLNDYQLTSGAAVFTNNARASGRVGPLPGCSVDPGIDLFTTPPGGTTFQDFSTQPIPPGFFGPGSDPFAGKIEFHGDPLDPLRFDLTDTIVERAGPAVLPGPGDVDVIPIEILALSLVSVNPITVTYNGGMNPELWNVEAALSSVAPQVRGLMEVRAGGCLCPEGGTFSADLPVRPRLVFERVSPPARQELDFGNLPGMPVIPFRSEGHWTSADPGFNLTQVPAGLFVDHDRNPATRDVGPLRGTSNFHAGVRAVRCDSASCGGPVRFFKRLTREQAMLAEHGILPAQRCTSGDFDGDGFCDDADNCPQVTNPLQEDGDDDGIGDACDNCIARFNPCQEDSNRDGIGDACQPVAVGDAPLLGRLSLSPPVPNPATGALSYRIELPRDARVRVRVFDVEGRLVRSLIDRALPAGRHDFTWNPGTDGGGRLRSGTYYLRLEAGGEHRSRPITLIR